MDLQIFGPENGSHFLAQPRKLEYTFYNWLLEMITTTKTTINFTGYINWLLHLVTTDGYYRLRHWLLHADLHI